jgi:hypothetical protein
VWRSLHQFLPVKRHLGPDNISRTKVNIKLWDSEVFGCRIWVYFSDRYKSRVREMYRYSDGHWVFFTVWMQQCRDLVGVSHLWDGAAMTVSSGSKVRVLLIWIQRDFFYIRLYFFKMPIVMLFRIVKQWVILFMVWRLPVFDWRFMLIFNVADWLADWLQFLCSLIGWDWSRGVGYIRRRRRFFINWDLGFGEGRHICTILCSRSVIRGLRPSQVPGYTVSLYAR